jgi:hypothetical protein
MSLQCGQHGVALDAIVPTGGDQRRVLAFHQMQQHHLIDQGHVQIAGLLDEHQTADQRLRCADPTDAQAGRHGL